MMQVSGARPRAQLQRHAIAKHAQANHAYERRVATVQFKHRLQRMHDQCLASSRILSGRPAQRQGRPHNLNRTRSKASGRQQRAVNQWAAQPHATSGARYTERRVARRRPSTNTREGWGGQNNAVLRRARGVIGPCPVSLGSAARATASHCKRQGDLQRGGRARIRIVVAIVTVVVARRPT